MTKARGGVLQSIKKYMGRKHMIRNEICIMVNVDQYFQDKIKEKFAVRDKIRKELRPEKEEKKKKDIASDYDSSCDMDVGSNSDDLLILNFSSFLGLKLFCCFNSSLSVAV